MAKHILFEDKYFPTNNPVISFNNKGLLLGLFFNFEIIGDSSYLFFPKETYEYFKEKCEIFNFKFEQSQAEFEQSIYFLLRKNRIYQGFNGIVTAFKNNNNFSTIISVEENKNNFYKLNEPIELSYYEEFDINAIDFVLKSQNFPFINYSAMLNNSECNKILIDKNNNIISTANSNILFIDTEGNIFIPKNRLNNGEKIILKYFINFAKENDINVIEKNINADELDKMEECFLLNTNSGIQWVKNINKEKYFFHKNIDKITKLLQEKLKTEIYYKKDV